MKKFDTTVQKNGKLLNILPFQLLEVSYAAASAALRKKDIKVNGKRVNENCMVFVGDELQIYLPDQAAQPVSLYSIVFQDDNVLIANKAKGIEVSDADRALDEIISADIGQTVTACHRLDRNTEGLVIFAKNQLAFATLTTALKQGTNIQKFYIAEVVGVPPADATLKAFLQKNEEESTVKIFSNPTPGAVKIVTKFSIIKKGANTAVLEVELETGKTHQIRAHLAYAGYPIIGDGKYGKNTDNRKFKSKTQLLCAHKLIFSFEPASPLYNLNGLTFTITPSWMR